MMFTAVIQTAVVYFHVTEVGSETLKHGAGLNSAKKTFFLKITETNLIKICITENWCIEFERWCPSLKVEQYYGSPDERKWLRHTWIKDGFNETEVILTT